MASWVRVAKNTLCLDVRPYAILLRKEASGSEPSFRKDGILMVERKTSTSSWSLLYGAGAVSAFAYVLMILVPLVLLVVQPQAPISGGAAILEYIAAHKAVYLVELICFVGLSLLA